MEELVRKEKETKQRRKARAKRRRQKERLKRDIKQQFGFSPDTDDYLTEDTESEDQDANETKTRETWKGKSPRMA
jgi:hypothetical protein